MRREALECGSLLLLFRQPACWLQLYPKPACWPGLVRAFEIPRASSRERKRLRGTHYHKPACWPGLVWAFEIPRASSREGKRQQAAALQSFAREHKVFACRSSLSSAERFLLVGLSFLPCPRLLHLLHELFGDCLGRVRAVDGDHFAGGQD